MSTHALTISVPTALVLSSNRRPHWAKASKVHSELRMLARATASHTKVRMERARCVATLGWPDRRDRDEHNYVHHLLKPLIDGVVDAGWLPNDSGKHLLGPDPRGCYTGRRGRVVVTLTFTELADGEDA